METIQIKHHQTGEVLFECEAPKGLKSGLRMRHALEAATKSFANLSYADLSYADLSYADLSSADLRTADLHYSDLSSANLRYSDLSSANLSSANLCSSVKLSGVRPFFSIGPIGSRADVLQAFTTDSGLRLQSGCFFGTLDEFRAKLINIHGTSIHREEYEAALLLIEKHAALWPAKGDES